MSKGLYVRHVHKTDTCEKKGCKEKATKVIQSPKKGVIWKMCNRHSKGLLGTYHGLQCNNCGCWHSTVK